MRTFTLIAALLFAPAAYGQSKTTDTSPKTTDTSKTAKPAKLSTDELQTLAHFHAVNLLEIDLGKTAQRIGKSTGVKDYGKMLVKDHTDADKKLVSLAKSRGQMIPAEKPMDEADKQAKADTKTAVAKLKKMRGAEFDNAFLTQMVTDHEAEVTKCDAKIAEAQDTELADTLRALKPSLQMHADHARELQKNMSGQASTTTIPPATARR